MLDGQSKNVYYDVGRYTYNYIGHQTKVNTAKIQVNRVECVREETTFMPSKMKETVSDRKTKMENTGNQNNKKSNNQKTDEEKAAKQKYFKQISYRINSFLDRDSKTGFQQQDIARALGMEKQAFNAYMKAETHFFSVQMLEKIADYLGCSVDHLLGKHEEKTKTLSEMAEYTGLSGDTLETLHASVERKYNVYRLFIDMFEYLLEQYKVYWYKGPDPVLGPGTYTKYARVGNGMFEMMGYVQAAIVSDKRSHERKVQRADEKYEESPFTLEKTIETDMVLAARGEEAVDSSEMKNYYLREASESFKKELETFIEEKVQAISQYTEYDLCEVKPINKEDIELFLKVGDAPLPKDSKAIRQSTALVRQILWKASHMAEIKSERLNKDE